jgi:hypothetical protein
MVERTGPRENLLNRITQEGRFFRMMDVWGWRWGQYQLTTHMSYLFAGGALERCFVLRSPAGDELVSCAYTHSLYEVAWKRAMTTRSNDRRERQIARKMMKAA